MIVISVLKPTDIRIARQASEYLKNNELSERAMYAINGLGLYDDVIIDAVLNYIKPTINNFEKARNISPIHSAISYLNDAPKNENIILFYNDSISYALKNDISQLPPFLAFVLDYYSKHKISNEIALDFALQLWGRGDDGWYVYKYLTKVPPCSQLDRLKAADETLKRKSYMWNAFDDESFDENMGPNGKLTKNFEEVELYPRIYNACQHGS